MSIFKDGGIFSQKDLRIIRWLRIQEETRPSEADENWWELRAYLIAEDRDNQAGDLPLLAGLLMREN
jgi:hypothetical protein